LLLASAAPTVHGDGSPHNILLRHQHPFFSGLLGGDYALTRYPLAWRHLFLYDLGLGRRRRPRGDDARSPRPEIRPAPAAWVAALREPTRVDEKIFRCANRRRHRNAGPTVTVRNHRRNRNARTSGAPSVEPIIRRVIKTKQVSGRTTLPRTLRPSRARTFASRAREPVQEPTPSMKRRPRTSSLIPTAWKFNADDRDRAAHLSSASLQTVRTVE